MIVSLEGFDRRVEFDGEQGLPPSSAGQILLPGRPRRAFQHVFDAAQIAVAKERRHCAGFSVA